MSNVYDQLDCDTALAALERRTRYFKHILAFWRCFKQVPGFLIFRGKETIARVLVDKNTCKNIYLDMIFWGRGLFGKISLFSRKLRLLRVKHTSAFNTRIYGQSQSCCTANKQPELMFRLRKSIRFERCVYACATNFTQTEPPALYSLGTHVVSSEQRGQHGRWRWSSHRDDGAGKLTLCPSPVNFVCSHCSIFRFFIFSPPGGRRSGSLKPDRMKIRTHGGNIHARVG